MSFHSIQLPYQGPLAERHEKERSHHPQRKVTIHYEEPRGREAQCEALEYFHMRMLVGHRPHSNTIWS